MNVDLIFKIAAVGILVAVLRQHRTEKSVQKMPFSGKIGVWINK